MKLTAAKLRDSDAIRALDELKARLAAYLARRLKKWSDYQ